MHPECIPNAFFEHLKGHYTWLEFSNQSEPRITKENPIKALIFAKKHEFTKELPFAPMI